MSFAAVVERLRKLENPYPGLRPFDTDESHLFFGRDEQVGELGRPARRASVPRRAGRVGQRQVVARARRFDSRAGARRRLGGRAAMARASSRSRLARRSTAWPRISRRPDSMRRGCARAATG